MHRNLAMLAVVALQVFGWACEPSLPDDLPSLLNAMGSTDMAVGGAAARKVAERYGREGLLAALKDKNRHARSRAAYGLAKLPSDQTLVALTAAAGDESEYVRLAVAYALGELKDARADPVLAELSKDPVVMVRQKAQRARERLKEGGQADMATPSPEVPRSQ